MKIMAVDYGDARTGLAVCDRTEFLASPVGQIEEKSMAKVAEKIIYATREFDVQMLVVGLPRNMDGSYGERAEKCRRFAKALNALIPIPVETWDERQTTMQAQRYLDETGVYGKKRKEVIDEVAATIILDSYLKYRAGQQKREAGDQE